MRFVILVMVLLAGCQHPITGKVWKTGNSYQFETVKGIKAKFVDEKEQVTLELDTMQADEPFWLIDGFLRLCGRTGDIKIEGD